MNPFVLIKRLIFVPKCAACEERLSPFQDKKVLTHGKICLCTACDKKWAQATAALCNKCALPAYRCTCTPKLLQKNYVTIPSLFFYDRMADNTQNRIIYTLKRKRNGELVEFLAHELYRHVINELKDREISQESIVFTWIPRSKKSLTKYGFDQGEELAKALAKLFKTKAVPLFLRRGGKEQKKLDADKRKDNQNNSIVLNRNLIGFPITETRDDISVYLSDKYVLIVDDVITTGASMRRGIDLVSSVSNRKTVILSIAKVTKNNPQ